MRRPAEDHGMTTSSQTMKTMRDHSSRMTKAFDPRDGPRESRSSEAQLSAAPRSSAKAPGDRSRRVGVPGYRGTGRLGRVMFRIGGPDRLVASRSLVSCDRIWN